MYTSLKNWVVILAFISLLCFQNSALSQQRKKPRQPTEQELLESLHPKFKLKPAPAGLKLLPGYKHKGATDFEGNRLGEIWKKEGLKFKYEMGMNEGMRVNPEKRNEYLEYTETTINGRLIRTAFTKEKVFTVSVSPFDSIDQANFYAKVEKIEEAKDMVTMIMECIQNKPPVKNPNPT